MKNMNTKNLLFVLRTTMTCAFTAQYFFCSFNNPIIMYTLLHWCRYGIIQVNANVTLMHNEHCSLVSQVMEFCYQTHDVHSASTIGDVHKYMTCLKIWWTAMELIRRWLGLLFVLFSCLNQISLNVQKDQGLLGCALRPTLVLQGKNCLL